MDNAPAFVALRDARDAAPNSTDYAGSDVADVQREHYPNLKTMVSQHSGNAVFSAAEEVAQEMGWEIAAAVPAEGRIEATATTKIYGFKDDVVIRVQPTMDGTTTVDVRSASRVGQGDLGANAIRIKIFLHTLETKLAE